MLPLSPNLTLRGISHFLFRCSRILVPFLAISNIGLQMPSIQPILTQTQVLSFLKFSLSFNLASSTFSFCLSSLPSRSYSVSQPHF